MGKSRFFKAYFIASLIYAVWFGVLMYAVDPMFLDVMMQYAAGRLFVCARRL